MVATLIKLCPAQAAMQIHDRSMKKDEASKPGCSTTPRMKTMFRRETSNNSAPTSESDEGQKLVAVML
eukprot:scaffold1184_cov132-Cylindrotheca_fusiformis.AAC.52